MTVSATNSVVSAQFPVTAIDTATGSLSQESLLSELMQGLEIIEETKAPLSLMEQDMLSLVTDELEAPKLTLAEAVAVVAEEKPKRQRAPKKPPVEKKAATVEPVEVAKVSDAPALEAAVEPSDAPVIETAPVAVEPEEKPAKRAVAPRMTFAKTSEKIMHKLGDKARDYLILELKDADLSDEDLSAKQEVLLDQVNKMAIKVQEKATMLFGFMRNGGKLNEIMRRTFTVLLRDGYLTSGAKGNLVANFEQKPYSMGTALSQSNQMFALFPVLGIVHPKQGQRFDINNDSAIIIRIQQELGL